jgi:hypothetical protein
MVTVVIISDFSRMHDVLATKFYSPSTYDFAFAQLRSCKPHFRSFILCLHINHARIICIAIMRSLIRHPSGLRAMPTGLRSVSFPPRNHIRKTTAPTQPGRAPQSQRILSSFSHPSRSFSTVPPRFSRNDQPAETPATDFNELNVLGNTPPPSTSVDVCMDDGFGLDSGLTITDGNGAILVGGEAFTWRPWELVSDKKLANKKGQFELPAEALSMFDMLWPRPGMLPTEIWNNNVFRLWGHSADESSMKVFFQKLMRRNPRSSHHRRRQVEHASQPVNQAAHRGIGHESGGSGYEERSGTVQSAGNGERR